MIQNLEHRNAFGFLRLLLASLVIVSHTAELKDGNRSREILTNIAETLSFGELAVDFFFIISGFLITRSFLRSSDIFSFFIKRAGRIYPAYIVAFLVCLLIVGPLGGTPLPEWPRHVMRQLLDIPFLRCPSLPDVFVGQPYPFLNGAMWTLSYEFSCYSVVVILGICGFYKRKYLFLSVFSLSVFSYFFTQTHFTPWAPAARFIMIFLCGALWSVSQDRVAWSWPMFHMATILAVISLFLGQYATPGIGIFGSYAILSFAFLIKNRVILAVNNRTDISYGVYLYAWPIEKLIFWYAPHLALIQAGLLDWAGSALCGIASWHFVEKPSQIWSHKMARRVKGKIPVLLWRR